MDIKRKVALGSTPERPRPRLPVDPPDTLGQAGR